MQLPRQIKTLLLIAVLTIWSPAGVAAQDSPAGPSVDLPAMTLTPADFEAVGLDGFGRFGNGEFRSLDAYAARRAEFLNKPEPEVRAAFKQAGWRGGYVANLGLPVDPGNPESELRQEAFSVVSEFADLAGATAAFELNQDYAGVIAGTIEVFTSATTFGDASYISHLTITDSTQDRPSDEVAVTFRIGSIVASTGLIVFNEETMLATPAAAPSETIAMVKAMAARMLKRIEGVVAGGSPDLSLRTVRLGGDDVSIAFSTEGYRRLNGDDPPYYNGYEDDFPGGGDQFDGVVTAYELNQGIQAPGDPYYVVRILEFGDEAGAAAYIDGVQSAGLSPAGTAGTVVETQTIGDASVVMEYGAEFEPGHPIAGVAVYARAGTTAMMILMEGAEQPALETVTALAEAQAACVQSGSCPAFLSLPVLGDAATPIP